MICRGAPAGLLNGPKQIERRVNTQLPPNSCHSRGRAVIERRKHETDSDLVERVLRHQRYR